MVPITGGSAARAPALRAPAPPDARACASSTTQPGSFWQRQRAAADLAVARARRGRASSGTRARRVPRRAAARALRALPAACAQHRERRNLACRALGIGIERGASPRAPPAPACRRRSARASGSCSGASTQPLAARGSGRPAVPPSSLSPENVTTSQPRGQGSPPRSARARARAPTRSTSAPLPRSSISGTPVPLRERRQLGELGLRGEALDAEVAADGRAGSRAMSSCCVERPLVVAQVGAVRGADLEQPGAALLHDLGDAERAADLDQLAARHHARARPRRERRQREQHRGRAVVHRPAPPRRPVSRREPALDARRRARRGGRSSRSNSRLE